MSFDQKRFDKEVFYHFTMDGITQDLLQIEERPKLYVIHRGFDSEPKFSLTFCYHRQHRRRIKQWKKTWYWKKPAGVCYFLKQVSHKFLKEKCRTSQIFIELNN